MLYNKTVERLLQASGMNACHNAYQIVGEWLQGLNFSSHPWKDRSYAPMNILRLTPEEIRQLKRLCKIEQAEAEERYRQEQNAEAIRKDAIRARNAEWEGRALSDDGYYRVHHGEAVDGHGNYIDSLPGDSAVSFESFRKKFSEMVNSSEFFIE